MAELRQQVGFVGALSKMRLGSLIWPEGLGALLIGGGGSYILTEISDLGTRLEVARDVLSVIAPLLGVVLAALTLVVAMMSTSYLQLLEKATDGAEGFLRPFILAIGVEIWTILAAIGYRATADDLSAGAERWLFTGLGVLTVFALLDILAIARNVLMHAITRSKVQ